MPHVGEVARRLLFAAKSTCGIGRRRGVPLTRFRCARCAKKTSANLDPKGAVRALSGHTGMCPAATCRG